MSFDRHLFAFWNTVYLYCMLYVYVNVSVQKLSKIFARLMAKVLGSISEKKLIFKIYRYLAPYLHKS